MSTWRNILSGGLLVVSALLTMAAMAAQIVLISQPDPMGIGYYVIMPNVGLVALAIGAVCCLSAFLLAPSILKYAIGGALISGLPLVSWPMLLHFKLIQMAKEQREKEKLLVAEEMVKGTDDITVLQAPTNAAWRPVQMNLTDAVGRQAKIRTQRTPLPSSFLISDASCCHY